MKRWGIIALAVVLVVAIGTAVGFRVAVRMLKDKIVAALGPGSELRELKVGWSSVELVALALPGPKDWPARRTLEAERVTIVPSLTSLLTDEIRIASITVEKPYIAALRTPGKLIIVPTLFHAGEKREQRRDEHYSRRAVTISRLTLHDGVMEIFDATVGRPPVKTRLEKIQAVMHDVVAPALKEKTEFEIEAVVKGARSDGRVKVSGWVAETGRESSSQIVLDAADLVSLQLYLIKKGEARIDKGTVDLNLRSEVRNNKLDGKGKVIIKDLHFAPSRNYLDTFMGVPRNAVINFLKNHNGAIDVDFALAGDVSHPSFSLNETLATRIASGMAEQLGVSIKGLAEGLGTIGEKGVEGLGKVGSGIGSAVKSLFSGGEKK
ncbi:MAG TPA: DUF748 domain-containing protein [Candidatus Binatia bacterium]|jgi:hypothetical protein